MPAGKLFQMRAPATANDLSQSAVLVRGTWSSENKMTNKRDYFDPLYVCLCV